MTPQEPTEKKKPQVLIVIGIVVAIIGSSAAFLSDLDTIRALIANNFGVEFKTPAQKTKEREDKIAELKKVAFKTNEILHNNLFELQTYFTEYNAVVDNRINCYRKILGERVVFITGDMRPGPPPAPYQSKASDGDKSVAKLRVKSLSNKEKVFTTEIIKSLKELYHTAIPIDKLGSIKPKENEYINLAKFELEIPNVVRTHIDIQNNPDTLTQLITDFNKVLKYLDSTKRTLQNRMISLQVKDDLDC
ncbi:MAG: hypothetical protein KZQ82_19350 [Candidatus Thiodiazotropha sp. (ex Lucinoma annulata)]|nr:hypothetical protein [Candidatus Thiodiazotropha sp. (ex Lucinoma annulata)]